MNPNPSKSLLLAASAFLGVGGFGLGQTAPAPAASAMRTDEATIKLDPFSVSADSDVGFVASSSLAGGRIATPLKDTPVAFSVITKEFLDAFNITDTVAA